jgi:hypothetical protein
MNKALFLTHDQVSHAHDTFFNGMKLLLGKNNVFDYPCVEKNHSDYKKHGHTYAWWCYNDIGHITSLSLEDWAEEINKKNINYVFASNRGYAIENLKLLIPKINKESFNYCTFVFIEEEEDPGFNMHRWFVEHLKQIYDKIDIHYKVDYIKNKVCNYDKIYPFYLSAPHEKIIEEIKSVKKFEERKYDVCFIAGNSHKNREKYFNILKKLSSGNNIIEFGAHKYSLSEYFKIINDSKIFISVRGNGWSNTRNVEGPICGAALFSEKIEIDIPNEYVHNENAIFFDENNLITQLEKYINSDELKILAQKSTEYCLNNHTSIARAKQFIALSKKIKGNI